MPSPEGHAPRAPTVRLDLGPNPLRRRLHELCPIDGADVEPHGDRRVAGFPAQGFPQRAQVNAGLLSRPFTQSPMRARCEMAPRPAVDASEPEALALGPSRPSIL